MKRGRPRPTCRRLKNTNLAIVDTVIDGVHEFRLYSIGLVRVMEVPLLGLHLLGNALVSCASMRMRRLWFGLLRLSMEYGCLTLSATSQLATCRRRVTQSIP